jgi:stage V sporulation protein B
MAALSAVSVKFVAMGLSKELAGAYNSAYGFLQLFAILADFGLYAVSVREVSAAKDKEKVLGGLLVLRSAIVVLSLGSAVAIAWVVPSWQGTPLPVSISIAAFVPFFTLLAGVLRTVFQVTFRMHYVFIAEVLQRVLTASLMGLIILLGVRLSTDLRVYQWFLWVGPVGAVFLFILSALFAAPLMRVRPTFDRELLSRLLKASAPYGLAFLCIALYRQFDLTMIAVLREDFRLQNAIYGFSSRVTEMTYLIPTFLLNSTLPVLSERAARGESTRSLLGKTLFLVLAFGSASSLFSYFWATPIMNLLTTPAYLASATQVGSDTALSLLSVPMFLNGIVLFSFYTLLTKHEWKPLVLMMMIAVVMSVTLNIHWIPSLGFLGAIRTATIVHIFLAATLFPLAARSMPISLPLSQVIRWLIFSAVLALTLIVTAPYVHGVFTSFIALCLGAAFTGLLAYIVGFHRVLSLKSASEDVGMPSAAN